MERVGSLARRKSCRVYHRASDRGRRRQGWLSSGPGCVSMHPTLQASGEALWRANFWCICLAFFGANAQQAQAQAQVLFDVPGDVPAECDQTVNEVLGKLRAIRLECDGDSCSSACGIAMVPYLEQCGEVVDAILGSSAASTVRVKRDRCVAEVSATSLFAQLAQRVSQGSCPEAALEGVGATTVRACVDSHQNCASRIAAGLATCATNFCATCDQASQCDQTCGLCTEEPFTPPSAGPTTGGGHRLQEASTCAAETFDDGAPPPRCCRFVSLSSAFFSLNNITGFAVQKLYA